MTQPPEKLKVIDYFSQMRRAAHFAGLSIEAACRLAGLHKTTLLRWSKGKTEPSLETTRHVVESINRYLENKDAAIKAAITVQRKRRLKRLWSNHRKIVKEKHLGEI